MNLQGSTLGPYRIVGELGRGGMARVYKAHHEGLDRYVAIKVLPEFFAESESYQERFRQEARSIARLKHPNILNIFDFGQERGITYLVMELVEGGTLADQLGGPIELERVVRLLRPIAEAVDHAHCEGILHRDIKPSNILIRKDGSPVLADFGLAKMADSARKLTASGTVIGTAEYMSPEQVSGEMNTPASDRYALAVVAYEMLTGHVPFRAETPVAVLVSHLSKPMPPPRELVGELSAHVEAVLRQGMAKDPAARYPSGADFIDALTPAAWVGRPGEEFGPRAARRDVQPGSSRRPPVVLVVDDSAANRELIEACLASIDCEVRLADGGRSALQDIEAVPPDLVLLDVQMPGLDGYEVCRRIRANPRFHVVPVVMITALHQTEDRVQALESGADDFMTKPVERVELVARVRSALRMRALNNQLETAEQVIYSLAAAVEARDGATEGHTHRVAESARHLGERLDLPENALDALYRGGIIHDIGKLGVSEAVLLKAGPLDPLELSMMRAHPLIGESIIGPLQSNSSLLPIIRHHHERFDGLGYPDGLRGSEIPLLARIISICDAFDALVNDRPHRRRLSVEEAIAVLRTGAGTQWDPDLVDLFITEMAVMQRRGVA